MTDDDPTAVALRPGDCVRVETEHGTVYWLDFRSTPGRSARWYRVPGSPESDQSYANRWQRLAHLTGGRHPHAAEPLRIGERFTVSVSMTEWMTASRLTSVAHVSPQDLPPESYTCGRCSTPIARPTTLCGDCERDE